MKICVANPSFHPKSLYLPYTWARFKTYMDLDSPLDFSFVSWTKPIYECDPKLPDEHIDVLALCCYVWNWEKNIELAKQAKLKNPNIHIILGGPHPDWHNIQNIFDTTVADSICYSEGEIPFSNLIYALQHGMTDIEGIAFRDNPIVKHIPKMNVNTLSSPWKHCKNELIQYAKQIHEDGNRVNVVFETNRGCPYGCTFCDWGSATNSKIKSFDYDMVMEEINIMMDMKPDFVFIADANYGIYKHDLTYIDEFVKCKDRIGHNTHIVFAPAKNKKIITSECYDKLYKAKMVGVAQIGIQHTDEEVLRIIGRDNIKMEESFDQMKDNWSSGIPLVAGLIQGNPADTLDKWKKCICDMFDMAFHEDLRIHDFQILPNAPASDPEYWNKYKLGGIQKLHAELPNEKRDRVLTNFLVESFSYTRNDWVEMNVWSSFYQASHVLSVFKFLAMYEYHTNNKPYLQFYDECFSIPTIKPFIDDIRNTLNDFMFNDKQDKFITYNNTEYTLENYLYLRMTENLDDIYSHINLDESLIQFQKFILCHHQEDKNDTLVLDYNYKNYFQDIMSLPAYEKTKQVPIKVTTTYHKDFTVGLYKNVNTKDITSIDGMKRLFNIPSNFRHRLFYYRSVME